MLNVNHLSINYGEKKAVDDVSFSVLDGEIVGIIGNNGSGKTSIISAIMQSVPTSTGQILLDNNNINKTIKYKNKIGYLPEDVELFEEMLGIDYLKYISCFRQIKQFDAKECQYINDFHLENILDSKMGTYSKGNKQKLAIVSCLIHNPNLLILDEAFDGLDPASIEKFRRIIKLHKEKGGSVLLCCHTLELVFELCDRIYVLDRGKILREINMKNYSKDNIQELYDFFVEVLS